MTELEIYKFIHDEDSYGIEISWSGKELIIWIDFCRLNDFTGLCGDYFDDCVFEVCLKRDCVAFKLNDVLEVYNIEPENILKRD